MPPDSAAVAVSDARVEAMKSLIENIVRALVDQPDAVQVTMIVGKHTIVIKLRVATDDAGKVIGKKGIHAAAIRRLIHAIGGKDKLRYMLEIMDERR